MNTAPALPVDPSPEFAALQPRELLDRLVRAEDRAPLELIDACVAHGEAMVEALREVIDDDYAWSGADAGEWWRLLHAAFILGRIPSESSGRLLVHLMCNMEEYEDPDLPDWVASHWPALFANKPECVIDAVRELAGDGAYGWYFRCQAVEVFLDAGLREGGQRLEDAIDRVAALVDNPSDEWQFRICAACTLLDFPRSRHRPLLEAMAQEERQRQAEDGSGFAGMFDLDNVQSSFALAEDTPNWRREGDPWKFYNPEAIADRQQRWREEREHPRPLGLDPATYVRPTPKVGRNELCPCGSGRKYKRCCLARDEATTKRLLEQIPY